MVETASFQGCRVPRAVLQSSPRSRLSCSTRCIQGCRAPRAVLQYSPRNPFKAVVPTRCVATFSDGSVPGTRPCEWCESCLDLECLFSRLYAKGDMQSFKKLTRALWQRLANSNFGNLQVRFSSSRALTRTTQQRHRRLTCALHGQPGLLDE